ncbi:glyoxalase/bleomycin resistance/dioxygenase family protein (plasmid) [Rhizobium sullae]|uniref:Glyoxalase/bleomycin resistance/dioxygenase family protein n=1 Tax=Rhizobium sullae TaxID=50338 RepID=A0ABY5XX83_RHISU|nr:VOC family protein [Rhizobium sullae]UWU19250.1 glyoxalase/bleomycin resistance/dioxygenase family protein [Rhizobium sullae]
MSDVPKLDFLTFYSVDPQVTANFYGHFGISFQSEKHGAGPVHYSSESKETIVEFYPATAYAQPKDAVMLGFEIADTDEAERIAKNNNFEILEPPMETPLGNRIILADPDGRRVLLYSRPSETRR